MPGGMSVGTVPTAARNPSSSANPEAIVLPPKSTVIDSPGWNPVIVIVWPGCAAEGVTVADGDCAKCAALPHHPKITPSRAATTATATMREASLPAIEVASISTSRSRVGHPAVATGRAGSPSRPRW